MTEEDRKRGQLGHHPPNVSWARGACENAGGDDRSLIQGQDWIHLGYMLGTLGYLDTPWVLLGLAFSKTQSVLAHSPRAPREPLQGASRQKYGNG